MDISVERNDLVLREATVKGKDKTGNGSKHRGKGRCPLQGSLCSVLAGVCH